MKTFATFFYVLLITTICFAQNGINYKAVIKDINGNVVANRSITVKFSILKGAAQTNVYTETHSPTTDANGIVIVSIGEGTPSSGVFNTITWGSDKHSLKVEINTGSGLVNMGTTEFKAVPYALNVTGLEQITESGNTGWRLKGRDPANYGNIGNHAIDLSYSVTPSIVYGATGSHSTALGLHTQASGINSTGLGQRTQASGDYSTALGSNTKASGPNSTAMGSYTQASGLFSTAMGSDSKALGDYSTSIGNYTVSDTYAGLAIGRYNLGGGSPTDWVATEPLFEIGIGSAVNARKNALTVRKDGKLYLTPVHDDASLANNSGYLILGSESGTNLVFDNNEIMARSNGNTSGLYLQQDGGAVYVGGLVVHSSDRRLKEDISDLPYGLNEILQLQPKSYLWKNRDQNQKSFGLIAQEVQPIIKELVLAQEDEEKTLSVNYTELIPILIKAIQEQQEIIVSMQSAVGSQQSIIISQESKIESLNAESEQKDESLKSFDNRLKQMEGLLKQTNQ